MSERQDIHVHVEHDEPRPPARAPVDEGPPAASFFTAQMLWIIVVIALVILLLAAFGSGVVDFGGGNGAVDPTAAP